MHMRWDSCVLPSMPIHNKGNNNQATIKMKKTTIFASLLALASVQTAAAQKFENMQWYNEPQSWSADGSYLTMDVTPHTDYWRISHYGFTVDDAPFIYSQQGGEFEVKVKVSGDYKTRFDQAGLMLRLNHENYIKAGIEFVGGKMNLSTVVTHRTSDWSVIVLDKPVPNIWLKAVRRLDAVEVFYSFDDKTYTMMRNAWLQDNHPVMVGVMGACPDGEGFRATFENFSIKHLPDQRRTQWLKEHAE